MANQTLALKLSQHSQRFFNRPLRRSHDSPNSKVDDIQHIEPEISQIVMNAIDQLLARKRMNPGLVFPPASADLRHNHQAIRIWMKSPLDNLIGHMRTVKVAG